jgi:hypothetical protein
MVRLPNVQKNQRTNNEGKMIYQKSIEDFLKSWESFRNDCERKAKDRCKINNEGWRKLSVFHTERFLRESQNPFGFLFYVRYKMPSIYRKYRLNIFYNNYLSERERSFKEGSDNGE